MYRTYSGIQKKTLTIVCSILYVLAFGTTSAFAFQEQNKAENYKQYKGEVIDGSSSKPLVFATLSVEGTNISTITNTEGGFLLKIPESITDGTVVVSFLGYKSKTIPLSQLKSNKNKISLIVSVTELSEVNINAPKDAAALVRETLSRKGDNYFEDPTLMTAFYRETIKKRRKNVSLSEAVVNIYKTPYNSLRKDAVELYKARKSTDYSKLDTVALKLQGGPFNALYVDIIKYPEYIFSEGSISDYKFTFSRSTRINDKLIYVIKFNQLETILEPLYAGELFIDVENKTLTSAIYTLNITDKEKAARLFVRRKPAKVDVWPTEVAYRVDYREKGGKWYYGYSNVLLEFKVDWKDKLFNSVYSMTAEMAVTDWEKNITGQLPKNRERIKKSIILSDEALGFSDPDFWGEYNIIEPEKSIESAIKKIQRQLRRSKSKGGTSAP
ncbi:carboxypeptidase-like regulatory domain-containing protein [Flagellimonas hymeniacidonis]|uniref:Carboxypeptidase-like regulatory domain-containing protein n=1 Tax=Flagellimonas hymeniacidonis TaxID=2603628 RepID=A0A5C8V3B6_9FLAO|nr:carboxypeptidase-like regulatory domain-containing protein [Flagellimonas hymeniacidonis]TXN36253.1 carboxypeptidase-like regulatory domain-containing protein [Flagellimonas hymeniacidonis]